MALKPQWLNVTLPLAAFLGAAAGVVIVERYRGVLIPPALAQATSPPQAVPLPEQGWPSGPAPANNQPPPDDLVPEIPGVPNPSPPPFRELNPIPPPPDPPAPGRPRSDADFPPIPTPSGRSPFPLPRAGAELPAVGIGGEQAMGPSPGEKPSLQPRPPAVPDEAMPDGGLGSDSLETFIRDHPLPADYFEITKLPKRDGIAMPVLQPGQRVQVEVLEALPGRPITGIRIIRPDGTISLGYYGDLLVAGMNRDQIKVKVLERANMFLTERVLGFYQYTGPDGDQPRLRPALESDRAFVDESINYAPLDSDLREQVKALIVNVDLLLKQTPSATAGSTSLPR